MVYMIILERILSRIEDFFYRLITDKDYFEPTSCSMIFYQ